MKAFRTLILASISILVIFSIFTSAAVAQSFPPLIAGEESGADRGVVTEFKFTNGTLTRSGTIVTVTISGGGGSAVVLDLADDGSDESSDLQEIATTNDTNSIFTNPSADKFLIDAGQNWPESDNALEVTCVGCVSDSELATDFISETELDTEAELEAQLSDVTNVFTNNDGALDDDDLSDNNSTELLDTADLLYETELDTEAELEAQLTDVTNVFTNNDGALNDDDVTLADVQAATTSDFHNIGGVDDDVPESGDFGNAVDLDATGAVSANAVALSTDTTGNYVATIADAGNSTVSVTGSGVEGATVTLDVIDVNCTGCLGSTEIAGLDAGDVTTGTFADARISQTSVTQHQAALTITESQISDLAHSNSFATIGTPAGTSPVADSTTDTLTLGTTAPLVITGDSATDTVTFSWSGTFADAQISESSVTQHQAALTITESQISDLAHFSPTDLDTDYGNEVITSSFDFGGGTLEIPNSTTLPGTCAVGEIYFDTDATTGQKIYGCESTNTWALQGDGGGGGGSSEWTDSGTTVYPTETTDDVVIGASSPVLSAKFSVDGDDDQRQLVIQGNATQTDEIVLVEKSDGTDLLTLDNSGNLAIPNRATASTLYSDIQSTTDEGLHIEGIASQTSNYINVSNSSGIPLLLLDSSEDMYLTKTTGSLSHMLRWDSGITDGESLGKYTFGGLSTVFAPQQSAYLECTAKGTWGSSSDFGSQCYIATTPDGSGTPANVIHFDSDQTIDLPGYDCSGNDNGGALTVDGSNNVVCTDKPSNIDSITVVFDGGGSAISSAPVVYLTIPYSATISEVTMIADQTGSIVIDIWKDTYANYPPTDADSITASAVPTISSAIKSNDSTLTGWTTSITAGDILGFNVDSASTITWVSLTLKVLK